MSLFFFFSRFPNKLIPEICWSFSLGLDTMIIGMVSGFSLSHFD